MKGMGCLEPWLLCRPSRLTSVPEIWLEAGQGVAPSIWGPPAPRPFGSSLLNAFPLPVLLPALHPMGGHGALPSLPHCELWAGGVVVRAPSAHLGLGTQGKTSQGWKCHLMLSTGWGPSPPSLLPASTHPIPHPLGPAPSRPQGLPFSLSLMSPLSVPLSPPPEAAQPRHPVGTSSAAHKPALPACPISTGR